MSGFEALSCEVLREIWIHAQASNMFVWTRAPNCIEIRSNDNSNTNAILIFSEKSKPFIGTYAGVDYAIGSEMNPVDIAAMCVEVVTSRDRVVTILEPRHVQDYGLVRVPHDETASE